MQKQQLLDGIAQAITACAVCQVGKTGKAVPGEGNPDADVMFVGEAPGKQEAASGRPFIGRSGQLLRKSIRESGLNEADVYITSPVKYLPLRGTPLPADIAHGKTHFDKQVAVINPKIIVLLGSVAALAVLGEKIPIMKQHGEIIEKEGRKHLIMLHPAAILRFPKNMPLFQADLQKLKVLLGTAKEKKA